MGFETLIGDFLNAMTFILRESLGENRRVRNNGVMNLWEGNQIRLKLRKVNIQGSIKSKGRRNGRYNYESAFLCSKDINDLVR